MHAYQPKLTDLPGTKAKYIETTGSSGGPIQARTLVRDVY